MSTEPNSFGSSFYSHAPLNVHGLSEELSFYLSQRKVVLPRVFEFPTATYVYLHLFTLLAGQLAWKRNQDISWFLFSYLVEHDHFQLCSEAVIVCMFLNMDKRNQEISWFLYHESCTVKRGRGGTHRLLLETQRLR